MFMEAVMESLKEMEVRHPREEQPPPSVCTVPAEPSEKDASLGELSRPLETEQFSSSVDKQNMHHSKAETISSADEVCESLKPESNSNSVIHSQNLASKPCQEPSLSSSGTPLDTSSVTDSGNTSVSACSDSSASVQSSSDTDVSHNTKATVTVVKNPASHIRDSLMRRWDFNFFRNSNAR